MTPAEPPDAGNTATAKSIWQVATPWVVLLLIGCAWGLTGPLSKIAVSTGHNPLGLALWDIAIGAALLVLTLIIRRRKIPLSGRHLMFFAACGFLGTALPHVLSFNAYRYLPVGVVVILISLVPMLTWSLALTCRLERFSGRRLGGVALGIVAVLLITLPKTSLPGVEQALWVLLPVITALSYAAENIVIATAKPANCDALITVTGFSLASLTMLLPTVAWFDAWVDLSAMGAPEQSLIGSALLHLGAYSGLIWLIDKAGPVFASQCGYIVTASGVLGGIMIFGEWHSSWVWMAMVLMFFGLALVQPRQNRPAGGTVR
jgi:drug/metabolite transporter (DMT)-like permease